LMQKDREIEGMIKRWVYSGIDSRRSIAGNRL